MIRLQLPEKRLDRLRPIQLPSGDIFTWRVHTLIHHPAPFCPCQ